MNKVLTVDIGNTHAHFGVIEDHIVLEQWSVPTSSLGDEMSDWSWTDRLHGRSFSGCSYCSVAPSVNRCFEAKIIKFVERIHHLNCRNLKKIKINYPKPEEIGQDRLANAVAAKTMFGTPAVVIDLGTAVTFDIVSASGSYDGGIIAPGLSLMTRYLHEKTELLPLLPAGDLTPCNTTIGKSTTEAMQIGCTLGYSGMIQFMLEKVLNELTSYSPEKAHVIMTGGDAGKLMDSHFKDFIYLPNLTVLGLYIEFLAG